MAILTLEEYKTRRALTEASKERDEAIEAALASAEDVVLQHTSRDFTTPPTIETKEYVYDGSGILETDDFTVLTNVVVEGSAMSSLGYVPGPREGDTYFWLDFTGVPRPSPKMGFTRNLDTIDGCATGRRHVRVSVTATFGWPGGAPAGVKQAVAWLVDEFRAAEGNRGDIQAEAIADLSFVYQRIAEESALPARITALLDPYRRIAL